MCLAQIRTITLMGIDCKWIREAFGTGTKRNGGETKRIDFLQFVFNGGNGCGSFRVELSPYIYSSWSTYPIAKVHKVGRARGGANLAKSAPESEKKEEEDDDVSVTSAWHQRTRFSSLEPGSFIGFGPVQL